MNTYYATESGRSVHAWHGRAGRSEWVRAHNEAEKPVKWSTRKYYPISALDAKNLVKKGYYLALHVPKGENDFWPDDDDLIGFPPWILETMDKWQACGIEYWFAEGGDEAYVWAPNERAHKN